MPRTAGRMAHDGSPRILIPRLSAIGDCIMTLPLLWAIRQQYPTAMIAWVVEEPGSALLKGHDCLDELVVLPRRWPALPGVLWRLRQRLRRLGIDTVVDPQSLTKSAVAGRLSGARHRIGLARPEGRELAPFLNNDLVASQREHVIDRSLELLRPLGIHGPQVEFRLPHNRLVSQAAEKIIGERDLSTGYVVLNPGAGWDSRLWEMNRYAEVARFLQRRHHLKSMIAWAGPREKGWANQIEMQSQGAAQAAPVTSLLELAELLRRARFYLGSDTGPMHLAAAVGTRCLSLHGPTNPKISGPYGNGHISLQKAEVNGSRKRRGKDNSAMKLITVAEVCQACTRLVKELGNEKTQEKTKLVA